VDGRHGHITFDGDTMSPWHSGATQMAGTFDDVIISVWRQTLVQNEKVVELADKRYFVKRTLRHRFRQVDFTFDGQELRFLSQPTPPTMEAAT
jgi:hypothetical protein